MKQWEIIINIDVLFFSATSEGTPYEQLPHDWPVRATPNKFWLACLLEKDKTADA